MTGINYAVEILSSFDFVIWYLPTNRSVFKQSLTLEKELNDCQEGTEWLDEVLRHAI